jgi:hypothetical protein
MSSTSLTAGAIGKRQQIRGGESFPQFGETSSRVISKIKEMYENPAVVFGRWIGVSDKTAKRKLKMERAITTEELGILIRSERGFEIVSAIMGDARPAWWRIVVPLMDAADARKMQIAARRRVEKTIESVLDADKALAASIQYAESLAVQDEEHVSHHLNALRSMGRTQNSSLAQRRVK